MMEDKWDDFLGYVLIGLIVILASPLLILMIPFAFVGFVVVEGCCLWFDSTNSDEKKDVKSEGENNEKDR